MTTEDRAEDTTAGRGTDRARRVQQELEAALAAVAEQERVRSRLVRARAAEESARRAAVAARQRLADETADVRALESLSPTRIWATLKGSRDTDLDREEAERQAAEYAAARADSWLVSTHDEVRRGRGRAGRARRRARAPAAGVGREGGLAA